MRHELFAALALPGVPPRQPTEFDHLLRHALAQQPRTLLVDEAQWLSGEALEYFRYLHDDPATDFALVLVGGDGCRAAVRRQPMLASRIFIWQHVTRLTPGEVADVIPAFHPVWAAADPDDVAFADRYAAHGNFRAWARLTAHTLTAMARLGRVTPDRDVLRWAFSRLG